MAKQQTVAPEVGFTAVKVALRKKTRAGSLSRLVTMNSSSVVKTSNATPKKRSWGQLATRTKAKMGFAFVRTWIITTPLRLRPETGLMIVGTM